jgi:hypothetical protein
MIIRHTLPVKGTTLRRKDLCFDLPGCRLHLVRRSRILIVRLPRFHKIVTMHCFPFVFERRRGPDWGLPS